MSRIREIVEKAIKEGGLGRTINALTTDKYNICFITGYADGNTEEENELANKKLEKDLLDLDYGFKKTMGGFQYKPGKVANEPGFQIIDSRLDPIDFFDEMVALGKKYNQWAILIKLKGEKVKQIITKPNSPDFGKEDSGYLPDQLKGADPTEPVDKDGKPNFGGYTQLQQDIKKNPKRAFQYTNGYDKATVESLTNLTEEELSQYTKPMYPHGRRDTNNGNLSIQGIREQLGLSRFYKLKEK